MPFIGGLVFCMYIHDKHDKIDEYHGHFFISRWEVRHKTCGAPRALYQGAFPPHAARRAGRLRGVTIVSRYARFRFAILRLFCNNFELWIMHWKRPTAVLYHRYAVPYGMLRYRGLTPIPWVITHGCVISLLRSSIFFSANRGLTPTAVLFHCYAVLFFFC